MMHSSPLPVSPIAVADRPLIGEGIAVPAKSAGKWSGLGRVIQEHRVEVAAGLVIAIVGLALRLLPFFGVPDHVTFDEYLYIANVRILKQLGLLGYPSLVHSYVDYQGQTDTVMLPPTRCVFIILGYFWGAVFHLGPQMSLRCVAAMFSVLSFLLAGLFAFRLGGSRYALIVGALMAVAPMELMLAHRELVDGVFAFWALLSLWLLWENMQAPGRLGWLAAYACAIAAMVLTKENAFFAAVGLGGLVCTVQFVPGLKLGKPAWSTAAATFAGGVMGVAILLALAGGPHELIETYRLLVTKAEKMDFAYETGGGPWFRYIIDLMLLSPTVLLPAIGGMFALRRENGQGIYLFLFVIFSCAVMVNVRNGMNVRYATMWDMPLRYLAAGMILQMAGAVRRAPALAAAVLVLGIAATELHHYWLFFVWHDLGEPVTKYLMYATEIVRIVPGHPAP